MKSFKRKALRLLPTFLRLCKNGLERKIDEVKLKAFWLKTKKPFRNPGKAFVQYYSKD